MQYIWNRIPKTICKNLVRAFDEKINLLGKDGERVNKTKHKTKKSNYSWKNNWNKTDHSISSLYLLLIVLSLILFF